MSKAYWVDCQQSEAVALYCDECDGEGEDESGYHVGEDEMVTHQRIYPAHQVTWLRREVA